VSPPRSSAHVGHGLLLARMSGTCTASVTFEIEDELHVFALPEGCQVPGSITVEKLKSLIGERAQKEVLYHEKLRFVELESRRPLEVDELVPLTPKVVKVAGPASVASMLRLWLAKGGQPRPKDPRPQPTPKPVAPKAGAAAAQQTGLTSRGYRPAAALPNGAGGRGVLQSGGQLLPSAYSGGYRGASGGVGREVLVGESATSAMSDLDLAVASVSVSLAWAAAGTELQAAELGEVCPRRCQMPPMWPLSRCSGSSRRSGSWKLP